MKIIKRGAQLLATCFDVGYFPIAPGTVASALTALLFYYLPEFSLLQWALLLAIAVPLSIIVSHVAQKGSNIPDPSYIVIDEFVGMAVAVAVLPKIWWVYCLAFGLFRFFDITKPSLIGYCDRTLPGGLGIVMDDFLAGICAWFITVICYLTAYYIHTILILFF